MSNGKFHVVPYGVCMKTVDADIYESGSACRDSIPAYSCPDQSLSQNVRNNVSGENSHLNRHAIVTSCSINASAAPTWHRASVAFIVLFLHFPLLLGRERAQATSLAEVHSSHEPTLHPPASRPFQTIAVDRYPSNHGHVLTIRRMCASVVLNNSLCSNCHFSSTPVASAEHHSSSSNAPHTAPHRLKSRSAPLTLGLPAE